MQNISLNNRIDYKRKIQEVYLAIELEKSLSKDDILEAYMNTIFLGGTAHGVEAAVQVLSKYKDNNGVPYNPSDDNQPLKDFV